MHKLWILLPLLFFSACHTKPSFDLETEKQKILDLHQRQRDLHFAKNAKDFVQLMSQNFIAIDGGKVSMSSQQENEVRFQQYFNSVEFIKWDDVQEPIIRFSDDGSMAYTVVEKEVVIRYLQEDEKKVEETTHFAWVAIYRKYKDEWKIDGVTSTNQPIVINEVNN